MCTSIVDINLVDICLQKCIKYGISIGKKRLKNCFLTSNRFDDRKKLIMLEWASSLNVEHIHFFWWWFYIYILLVYIIIYICGCIALYQCLFFHFILICLLHITLWFHYQLAWRIYRAWIYSIIQCNQCFMDIMINEKENTACRRMESRHKHTHTTSLRRIRESFQWPLCGSFMSSRFYCTVSAVWYTLAS